MPTITIAGLRAAVQKRHTTRTSQRLNQPVPAYPDPVMDAKTHAATSAPRVPETQARQPQRRDSTDGTGRDGPTPAPTTTLAGNILAVGNRFLSGSEVRAWFG